MSAAACDVCLSVCLHSVPVQWVMASVTVGGQAWSAYDAAAETVDVTTALAAAPNAAAVDIVVTYKNKKQNTNTNTKKQGPGTVVALKTDDGPGGFGGATLPPPPPAPSVYTVTFTTDVKPHGDIPVVVTRSWAPLGADRFYAAVQDGFYNNSAFFRVVAPNSTGCRLTCGGIVQFGISGDKAMNQKWLSSPIKDDPVTQVRRCSSDQHKGLHKCCVTASS